MALRALAVALAIAASPAAADRGKPPAKFFWALAKIDGFRLDSRDADWTPRPLCSFEKHKTGCALIEKSWRARTVKIGTRGRGAVAQELWLARYDTPIQVEQAARSFATEFNDGPFAKHPFKMHACGDYLLMIEGRHRSPTPLKELSRSIGKALGKRCKSL